MDDTNLKKILDASMDLYLVVNEDGTIIDYRSSPDFKPAWLPVEFKGKNVRQVLPETFAEAFMEKIAEVLHTNSERMLELEFPAGGEHGLYETRLTPFEKTRVLVVIRDVSEYRFSRPFARSLINASDDLFLLLDQEGRILAVNEAAAAAYGKTPEQMEMTLYWDYLTDENADVRKQRLESILGSGEPARYVDLGGDGIYDVSGKPVREPDGSVRCAAFFVKDITEQISAEQELIESETRHRRLFDENPVPMYIYDTTTLKILEANASFIESYGYSRDELTSMTLNDIRPPEDVSKLLENVTDLQSKQVYLGLWRHTKKDGSVIDVEITSGAFPFMDKPARLVLCHDVTEKIRIQKALEEREEQYRHLFEYNPMPMFIIEPETLRIINVNMATISRYGYEKEEILKMTLRDIRPPEDIEETVQRIKSMTGPVVKFGISRHLTKDGELMFMDISSHEIQYEGRKARLALCSEVTDQIAAREALEESELKFRSIVESSPMGLHMYRMDEDDNLILTDANPAADRILGIEHRPFMGSKIEDVFPGVGDSDLPVRLREVCLSGSPWSTEQLDYKDHQIDGAFEVYAFQTGQRTAAVLFLDVTEKKRAEEAIAESEEKFRLAFMTSPDSVNINKLENGEFVDINEGFSQIMGYDRDEIIGRTSIELDIWEDIKDRERLIEALKRDGYAYNLEARFRAKNGEIGIGLMSAKIINLKGEMHILSITRDITDFKNTQNALLRSEEQLKASLGEKEMLLREIHHRVKNNLQVISGLLDLQAHHIRDPVDRELYKDSQNRVITMALIHEALYQSANLSQVDFAEYIRNLCENLMVSYGADRERIKLEIEAEKTEMVVDTAIPCGLIINELITNALKHAFPGDRKGTISLIFRRMRNRNYLLVVSDDGVGIPRDMDINDTSTLGMQLVSVLTGQLGGTLKVRRREGTGFTIKFKEYHEAGSVLY